MPIGIRSPKERGGGELNSDPVLRGGGKKRNGRRGRRKKRWGNAGVKPLPGLTKRKRTTKKGKGEAEKVSGGRPRAAERKKLFRGPAEIGRAVETGKGKF